jgi:hypothetical protein
MAFEPVAKCRTQQPSAKAATRLNENSIDQTNRGGWYGLLGGGAGIVVLRYRLANNPGSASSGATNTGLGITWAQQQKQSSSRGCESGRGSSFDSLDVAAATDSELSLLFVRADSPKV